MRRTLAFVAAVLLFGCNRAAPTSPTPAPPPTPEVTVSVSGWVWDTIHRRVSGARVEVTTGRLAGTFVTANDDGEYTFPEPLPIVSQLRASKPGHVDTAVVLSRATQMPLVFELGSSNPPTNLTGQYDITFEADAICTALPDIARKRTYQASPRRPATELSGAVFLGGDPPANVIIFSQFEEYARFVMYDPPIWELIPNAGYVMISGDTLGVVNPDFSQLLVNGVITYCPNFMGLAATCSVETVSCRSSRHVMTLKRR